MAAQTVCHSAAAAFQKMGVQRLEARPGFRPVARRDRNEPKTPSEPAQRAASAAVGIAGAGDIRIGRVVIRASGVPKPAIGLAVLGLLLLGYAAFHSGNRINVQNGSYVGGNVSNGQNGVNVHAEGRDYTVNIGPTKEQTQQIVKDIVKKLERDNPNLLPSIEHGLGTAVGTIAQGAAQGDLRFEKVFTLVKEGKIEEALPLIIAIAEDDAARAKQAKEQAQQATQQGDKYHKEAAIVYGTAGVLASLSDPKRALEYFEQALKYDPNDLESLVRSGGLLQSNYGDLDKAQARLERALALAKTDDQGDLKFCAQLCLGDIKKQRGKLSSALNSYQDGHTTADRMRNADPSDAKWQYYFGISNESIGDVLMKLGKSAAAREPYQARQEITLQLTRSDPNNKCWQRDLSISYQKIGDLQKEQSALGAAIESYRKSHDIIAPLAQSNPDNLDWQRDLGVSDEKIGEALEAQGHLETALEQYRDGHVIFERLAQSDPNNMGWQRDLSVSYGKIGGVLEAQGNFRKLIRTGSLLRRASRNPIPILRNGSTISR
jgi:tetratricopeptide (TPR) repeat protein